MNRNTAKAEKSLMMRTRSFKGDMSPKGKGKRRASKARRHLDRCIVRDARKES